MPVINPFNTQAAMTKDKIVLVSPAPQRIQFGPIAHLPLALLSLAAWLEGYGIPKEKIKILDGQLKTFAKEDFADAAIVGITAMTGFQIKYGLEIAALTRSVNQEALLVWGGVHPSLLPEQTIMDPLVDIVVTGEGEQTFLEIVETYFSGKSLEGIPGTCLRNGDGEIIHGGKRGFLDLNDLPLPSYDLVDIDKYKGIRNQFDYQSSRGCPFRCGFCYNTVFCGRKYRKKSAEKVLYELIALHDKYKITNFGFVDDEFFIEKKRVETIMDGIIESGRKFEITASCRLDVVCGFPDPLLKKMKQAGVSQIFFGAESGSPSILKNIQKDITQQQIIEGSKKVAEAGIRPMLSFMSGFPGETLEDLEMTLDTIRELWDIHPLITINGIFPFNAYPGTMLYQQAVDLGFAPPSSLHGWSNWSFQYEPDNPWLDRTKKRWMQIAFYMVRFKYYIARYEDRYNDRFGEKLLKIITWPLISSLNFRIKKRWFSFAWEWHIFAFIARKTFGYL